MSLTYYVSIYGLIEALLISLTVIAVFGFKWWKLRQLEKQQMHIYNAIVERFKAEIVSIHDQPPVRAELQDTHVLLLKAIGTPFKKHQVNTVESWVEVINQLARYCDNLTHTTQAAYQPSPATQQHELPLPATEPSDVSSLSAENLDSVITDLMSHYQSATSAIAANQEATAEMKNRFQNLQLANQELRTILQADKTTELLEKFDAYEQTNAAFMRALSVKERNYKLLVQEHEMLQVYIHNLQITVANYRKSIHKLLFKQNSLVEENKQLLEQQESTNHLVSRLNRNYETLRNEYTKLFETIR